MLKAIAPQKFTVTAEHVNGALSSLSGNPATGAVIKLTASNDKDSLSTDVLNLAGATLPSTGGSGTTMLYIIGVILLAGAGILLVTRRRIKAE